MTDWLVASRDWSLGDKLNMAKEIKKCLMKEKEKNRTLIDRLPFGSCKRGQKRCTSW